MPDTPMKPSSFVHPSALSTQSPAVASSSPIGRTPTVSLDASNSHGLDSSPTAMDTGSPVGSGGILNAQQTAALALTTDESLNEAREALSPLGIGKKPFQRGASPLSIQSQSPLSIHSGVVEGGEVSPTVHASTTEPRTSVPTTKSSLGRVRPALFRRRSSGQISNEGSFISQPYRSGSSSSSNRSALTIGETEPMTPTRATSGKFGEGEYSILPVQFDTFDS
jgi:hypothetical protein